MDLTQTTPSTILGLDVSDKTTSWCEVTSASEDVIGEGCVPTTKQGLERLLGNRRCCRVVLEVGKHSPWLREAIEELGHEAVVANPRRMPQIWQSSRKTDRKDAEILAQLGRLGTWLLHPVTHRSTPARHDLNVVRARDRVIECRTKLINLARGMAKTNNTPLPRCDAKCFARKIGEMGLPEELQQALDPIVELVSQQTATIKAYDKTLQKIAEERYPEHEVLRQIHGVGLITSLTFLLVIDDPSRFRRSRDVGAYLGLVPRLNESGERRIQSHITREGDALLRRLLTQSAHYMLGPFGEDCDLRRHGERIVARGGERAKRRAVVAVARKLSVLLHHLWITSEVYERDHSLSKAA